MTASIQQEIADGDRRCLEIAYEDVDFFFHKEDDRQIVDGLRTNTKRYIEIFTELAEQLMPKRIKQIPEDEVSLTTIQMIRSKF